MRLATIPPFCLNKYMLLSDYQLVLPECFRNEPYTETVYQMRKPGRSDFIILDNGAAEGNAWHPQALLAVGREFQVNEIVIPDMLGEKDATLDMLEAFIGDTTEEERQAFKWMGVPQGATFNDFVECVEAFASLPFVSTVGVPRHMLQTLGDNMARVTFAKWIDKEFTGRFDIHFLGSSAQWLLEPRVLQEECAFARGMDTSLPYFAANLETEIDDLSAGIIARPEGYFELPSFEFPIGLLEYNMRTLKGWLYG
jgi:hypothetical protein